MKLVLPVVWKLRNQQHMNFPYLNFQPRARISSPTTEQALLAVGGLWVFWPTKAQRQPVSMSAVRTYSPTPHPPYVPVIRQLTLQMHDVSPRCPWIPRPISIMKSQPHDFTRSGWGSCGWTAQLTMVIIWSFCILLNMTSQLMTLRTPVWMGSEACEWWEVGGCTMWHDPSLGFISWRPTHDFRCTVALDAAWPKHNDITWRHVTATWCVCVRACDVEND